MLALGSSMTRALLVLSGLLASMSSPSMAMAISRKLKSSLHDMGPET